MSSVHCVVVWEWQAGSWWLPHAPGVARTLERAHAKRLTRVVLGDADPALQGRAVNLRTLTQGADTEHEGGPPGAGAGPGADTCRVRRACYSVQSPAGRGARWEWARLQPPPRAAELLYEPLPMEVQCRLEDVWTRGGDLLRHDRWLLSVARMTARREGAAGGARLLRRAPQPPYPLTRSPAPPPPPLPPPPPHADRTECALDEGRRPRLPQQLTGSSVHAVPGPGGGGGGARSASPRERRPGLARQILHNLNIFSNSKMLPPPALPPLPLPALPAAAPAPRAAPLAEPRDSPRLTDTESGSTRSARRHSVDTVSTYLSHESKESLQQAPVGELLNCSAGSDDVFEEPSSPAHGTVVGAASADSAVSALWAHVAGVARPQWGALCPACLRALRAGAEPAVALRRCQHMLHLHCLDEHLARLHRHGEPLYIECLVCGEVYGEKEERPQLQRAEREEWAERIERAERAERGEWTERAEREEWGERIEQAAREGGEEGDGGGWGGARGAGEQPAGSMAWSVQPAPLPGFPPGTASILVTYNFQSGRQGAQHPAPGEPYYAVGFPRHTLLPDTPLGRQVLSALRAAWERRVLFGVGASQTTGREHVVAWRVRPPPAAPHHYRAEPRRLLQQALERLQALLAAPSDHY